MKPNNAQDPWSVGGVANPQQRRAQRRLRRAHARKTLVLKSISVLPAMFTVMNGLLGFGAIYMATRDIDPAALATWANKEWACLLILLAMVCDMLDGRLARWARKTTEFGAQLDSLCDAISFGVAPAILMLRTVGTAMHEGTFYVPWMPVLERVVWCIAAVYVACGVIRLARFNVENEPDESAHMSFKGLPIPGAAAVVTSLVLLFTYIFVELAKDKSQWPANPVLLAAVGIILPLTTLLCALLMVSRYRYPHIVNKLIRGKKPVNHLVQVLAVVLLGIAVDFHVAIAAIMLGFALSGPVSALIKKPQKPAPMTETK